MCRGKEMSCISGRVAMPCIARLLGGVLLISVHIHCGRICYLQILLLLSEESLVGTFLGALCSYEHSAPTHFGFPLGTAVAPRVFAIVATREETRQVSVAFGCN